MKRCFYISLFITSLFLVVTILLLTVPVWAQTTGTISGVVTDEEGNALPGANISVKGILFGAATDLEGKYVIKKVPSGQNTLIVTFIGYRSVQKEVTVPEGGAVTADFSLAVDMLEMDAIVVTGTRTPRSKRETALAISTLSPREIEMAAPRSTTEMLRYVPGFTRVESSGGEVNQNISVRGIYGVEFVMFMEDGLPVFPTMHTYFMNADNLFRPDENIAKMEVVRGGNAALFGSNTPGAIINFLNKTGGPEVGGVAKASAGTKGLARYDFNVNGPLGENWRFNVGGFYRYDHGVRDPGFPGIRGGQLKMNVTRLLDNGYIRASAKLIDDRNQFILPLPFQNPDDPDYVEGFSDYGAFCTNEGNHIRVPLPLGNGELELPLDDGLRTKAYWLTADVGFDFGGGWGVQNAAQIMQNDQGWNAILPFDVMKADDWAADRLSDLKKDGLVPDDATYKLFFTNHFDAAGNPVRFNTKNGLISPGGEWHVEKPISAFQDQLQLSKKIGNHKLSLGLYFAHYTQDNRWFFTEILTDVRDNPRFVDMLVYDASGNTALMDVTKNGFRRYLSLYVNSWGQTTILSPVVGLELQLTDRLHADLGYRFERNNFVQTSENSSDVDLDGDATTLYDNENWGNGTFRYFNQTFDEWASSVGLNYLVTDQISVYALGSRAYKMPALDEFIFPAEAQAEIFEPRHTSTYEGGVKFSSSKLGLAANGFWGEVRDITGQGAITDTLTGEITWTVIHQDKIRSYGAEIEVSARPISELNLLGSAILIKAEFGEGADIGSWIAGVPSILLNLSGTYTFSGLTLLADFHYVGKRWVQVDVTELKPYNYFNLGASYRIPGKPITLSANLLNVLQSKGFEEGNPRLPEAGKANLFLARPILPRRLNFSISYNF